MSYASMLMGMNLYNVGNCLPHRMQYPIGAATGTSHAAGVAALYLVWARAEYELVPDKVGNIFQAMVNQIPRNSFEAEKLMANFLVELEMSINRTKLGIKEEQIPVMVNEIRGDISVDPVGAKTGICESIYRDSLFR